MTWREQFVVGLLLLVARIVCDDAETRDEIRKVANHVSVHGRRDGDPKEV